MIHPEDLFDKTEEEARKMVTDDGLRFRVVWKNGQPRLITHDVRLDRMNVAIGDDNKVARAYIG